MSQSLESKNNKAPLNLMEAFLYLLAGSAMTIISVSFLLWLRF